MEIFMKYKNDRYENCIILEMAGAKRRDHPKHGRSITSHLPLPHQQAQDLPHTKGFAQFGISNLS